MTDVDVIVCGAGPAGASAARKLAEAGWQVLVLEKEELPRHKPCGGGVPNSLLADLNLALPSTVEGSLVECNVTKLRHTWCFQDAHIGLSQRKGGQESALSLWMVQRSVFDNALTDAAQTAGATIRAAHKVLAVSETEDRALVTYLDSANTETSVSAKFIIGADGVNGLCRRYTEASRNASQREASPAIGIELELPFDWQAAQQYHPSLSLDTLHLDYGVLPNGYAWVFPKKDHLNIGAGFFSPSKRPNKGNSHSVKPKDVLQKAILDYASSLGIDTSTMPAGRYYAHTLPIWSGRKPRQSRYGRILLVGDAASLVGPLFGDGIANAITSASIAADCLIAEKALEYETLLHEHFEEDLDTALFLARLFYRWPRFFFTYCISHPNATALATELLAGKTRYRHIRKRVLKRIGGRVLNKLLGRAEKTR